MKSSLKPCKPIRVWQRLAVVIFLSVLQKLLFAQAEPGYAVSSRDAVPDAGIYSEKLSRQPLLFVENKGQVADAKGKPQPEILFTANNSGATIYLTATSIHYQFIKIQSSEGHHPRGYPDFDEQSEMQGRSKQSTHRFTLQLQGSNPHPLVVKEKRSTYTENFYLTHCPNGITDVLSFEKITYKEVYPGIDWIIYSKDGFMEYDFLVHPGADANAIQLKILDADKVSLAKDGGMVIETQLGKVTEHAPVSYDVSGSEIATRFVQKNDGTICFSLAAYNKKENLVIDPSVIWSTYYGGNASATACTTDGAGNVFLVGNTSSTSGIADEGFQNTIGGFTDAYMVKFDAAGNRLWATYYGGSESDVGQSCAVDPSGNIYLAGSTDGSFQNNYNDGSGAFLLKFDTKGHRIWANFYSGIERINGSSCAADALGNVYLAGTTWNVAGIASGGFQNTIGGFSDAFLVKFDSNGNRLWATYYGGTEHDFGRSCAVDAMGNVYLAGDSFSPTGIASGGFQNTYGGGSVPDAFLVKFDASGNRLWATYYGGNGIEYAYSCATDGSGNVYLTGYTYSKSGMASGGFQNTFAGATDVFLVKFSSTGNRLWATYYGGSDFEGYAACATDAMGNVYLTGQTNSVTGIASGGFQNTFSGITDAFLVKFDAVGNRVWGTYFGGSYFDGATYCAVDASGNIYLAGETSSNSGVAFNGFQNTMDGDRSSFLAKITASSTLPLRRITLNAYQYQSRIEVTWVTTEEQQVSQHEVERSSDAQNFTAVGRVPAKNEVNNIYTFIDLAPLAGDNYYRIKTTSFSGAVSYSAVVKLMYSNGNAVIRMQNPASGNTLKLFVEKLPEGMYTVQAFDAGGRLLLQSNINHQGARNNYSLSLQHPLSRGWYSLRVTNNKDKIYSLSFICK